MRIWIKPLSLHNLMDDQPCFQSFHAGHLDHHHNLEVDAILWSMLIVLILIAMTAFFVATEFAIVKLRPSRVNQLVAEGVPQAKAVQKVTTHVNEYLSACQLGITIASLGIGWLGEPAFVRLFAPLFELLELPYAIQHLLSFIFGFTVVTYISVVVGELLPKTIALFYAEPLALRFAMPIIWFYRILFPFIWLLNNSANSLARLLGFHPEQANEQAHSEDEILLILSNSLASGEITKTEYGYVNRIFSFDELSAKEIMVPRTAMVVLYADRSLQDVWRTIRREQYTRFPVARDNKDHIIGIINTKQLFLEADHQMDYPWERVIRPVLMMPETAPIKAVLRRMQQEHSHMAILLDEYGGTAGLITIEDILEEIVGEIRDEFDEDEVREIAKLTERRYLMDGVTPLVHVTQLVHVDFDDDEADTIGGWLINRNSELRVGQKLNYGPLTFIVKRKEKHRIKLVEMLVSESHPISVSPHHA
ncbi:hemolysin family protein [Paenibacillus sp. 1001270B_150601_E10]|uniref:hemolysin family protein n=1 Tax=Paenibacillus sp. 1001270B_150601_E10 TaxID=2787079 RepID=UPI001E2BD33F|nr:hemolysin family protein [Paenibacillus sp. 1001270B_150601_E10]